jgi:NHL repeat-containing protein
VISRSHSVGRIVVARADRVLWSLALAVVALCARVRARAKLRLACLSICGACGAVLVFGASGAQALRIFDTSFGAPGAAAGQFAGPQGVGVNTSSGDVYVADSGNFRIEEFDQSGTFIRGWGWGVATGASAFEICTSSCQAGLSGSGAGQFTNPAFVAVDNSSGASAGDVYVGDPGADVVSKFDSAGNLIASWGTGGQLSGTGTFGSIDGIAVDSSGNLLVINGNNSVFKFAQDGTAVTNFATVGGMSASGLAVDSSGNLFKVNGDGSVEKLTSTGSDVGQVTQGGATGLAVDPATGDLYVDTGPSVGRYAFDTSGNVIEPDGTTCTPTPSSGCGATDTFGSGALSSGTGLAVNPNFTPAGFLAPAIYVADASSNDALIFASPIPLAPTVDSESAANVTTNAAVLRAEINPQYAHTTYQFQFGTDTSYSGGTLPATPVDIGDANTDQAVSVMLSGLLANTTYHYRVVAVNSVKTVAGPDRTFVTYAAGVVGLPDGRGYEMVSPPQKDSGEPYIRAGFVSFAGTPEAAIDGNRMAYVSLNAFPGAQFDGSFYLATRGTSSWSSQNLAPLQAVGGFLCPLTAAMAAYSADLSKGILDDGYAQSSLGCGGDSPPLVSGEPKGFQNLFVRDNSTGTYQLVDVTPPGVQPADATFDGASADLSHVVFDENAPLTANAPSGDDLYEWVGGTLRLVTILANGTPVVGSLAGGYSGNAEHAVSADGSRIFFTANGNLYVRENGTSTVQVDASQAGGGGGGGQFAAASADGSKVFFTDDASAGLTSSTVAGSGANLYQYDLTSGTLTDLTPVSGAQVAGVSGASDDGSYVYFVASGSLASGATAGQPNLYVLHGGTTTFIATLNGSDSCDWTASCLTARVSSNGAFIAFNSIQSLTGYDNSGQPEIFLYGAGADQLACASCNPSGVPATAGASISSGQTALTTSLLSSQYLQRYVSDSGQVFFDTSDALLLADTNGKQDVYEYESGQLRLLSTGTSRDDSWFFDASPSGSDVFFATSQQLVPQDADGAYDIYDARAGGGFPASAPAPSCQGDGCQGPLSAAAALPSAASAFFSGLGNVTSSGQVVGPAAAKFSVAAISKAAQKTFARTGKLTLTIVVSQAGTIDASATARIAKHTQTVAFKSVKASRAGTVRLTLTLDKAARKQLRQHKLKVTITVRFSVGGLMHATMTLSK